MADTITEVVRTEASSVGAVDGDLVVVSSHTVTVSVRVVKESALKHLVI
jgi:hypothetical protein